MNNEIKVLNKAERMDGIKALEGAGFPTLRSGLGIIDGRYLFLTPNSDQIYATKAISTSKGNFGLTLVAGTLRGAQQENKEIAIIYGLSSQEKQFVVLYDHFMLIEPNQAYEVQVFNGRVKTLKVSESIEIVDTASVITDTRKQKVVAQN